MGYGKIIFSKTENVEFDNGIDHSTFLESVAPSDLPWEDVVDEFVCFLNRCGYRVDTSDIVEYLSRK